MQTLDDIGTILYVCVCVDAGVNAGVYVRVRNALVFLFFICCDLLCVSHGLRRTSSYQFVLQCIL